VAIIRICRPPKPLRALGAPMSAGSAQHFQFHLGNTAGGDTELLRGSVGQINHPVAMEGPPVVDAHYGRTTVPEIGNPHPGAKRQGAMGGRKRSAAKLLTVGSA